MRHKYSSITSVSKIGGVYYVPNASIFRVNLDVGIKINYASVSEPRHTEVNSEFNQSSCLLD